MSGASVRPFGEAAVEPLAGTAGAGEAAVALVAGTAGAGEQAHSSSRPRNDWAGSTVAPAART